MDSAKPLPLSRTAERLLAQLQAEAQAATLEALSAKDGIVVLQPIERERWTQYFGDSLFVDDSRGAEAVYTRDRKCPDSWIGSTLGHDWHPSYWRVRLTLVDGQGRKWVHSGGNHVVDDFGNLVSVEGGAS